MSCYLTVLPLTTCSLFSWILFFSVCSKCVPTNRRQNGNSVKFPNYIAKIRRKCIRLSKGKHLPNGMLNWRAANNEYMLAIQRFVINRECAILQSGDSSAFYKYVNNRRVSKDGVSPLFNTDGNCQLPNLRKLVY